MVCIYRRYRVTLVGFCAGGLVVREDDTVYFEHHDIAVRDKYGRQFTVPIGLLDPKEPIGKISVLNFTPS